MKLKFLAALLLAVPTFAFAQYYGPGVPTLTCAASGQTPPTQGASWTDTTTGIESYCVAYPAPNGTFQWVSFNANGVVTVNTSTSTYVSTPYALTYGSGNNTNVTVAVTNATTSFASAGLTFPVAPASATLRGHCAILWQGSSASYTTDFGIKTTAAPTDLYYSELAFSAASAATGQTASGTITTATTTDTSTSLTPATAATNYPVYFDFLLVNGSSANTVSLVFKSSNTSGTSQVSPGSFCEWLL